MNGQADRMIQDMNRKREMKKLDLIKKSQERLEQRGAPNFGVNEDEFLQMRQKIKELTVSNNMLVEHMKRLDKDRIFDCAIESHYMMQVILGFLVNKGIVTKEEIDKAAQDIQMSGIGLLDKENKTLEASDIALIRFKLFDEDKLVAGLSDDLMTYEMGSNGLPCEENMLGIKVGETRFFDVVFSDGFRIKELVGKTLKMQLTCHGVRVKANQS